jgi:predicted metal-dependent phosphoesterase TrpH
MRCDLHVHTIHSGMCTVPVARRFCRESYTNPEQLHARLKRLGMDLVTVTDHDSVDAAEALRRHPDFFLSEEVTCTMPGGAEAHLAVYDITDHDHVELQRRRADLPALLAWCAERNLIVSVNHLFSGLTGRRNPSDYDWFRSFSHVETLNGAVIGRANRLAGQYARQFRKTGLGGSDAHTLASAGKAWTEVRGARTRQEFLDGIRAGHALARGSSGSYFRLTRDVLSICVSLFREKPAMLPLLPLAAGVPAVLLANYVSEALFASRQAMRTGLSTVGEVTLE